MTGPSPARSELSLPLAVTSLMKGVVYRDTHEKVWRHLIPLQSRVRDYVATMGLVVVIDEAEGYAFLRSRPDDDSAETGEDDDIAIPRLIPRRSLSLHVSLLLALLRKKLAEFDAQAADTKLVLHRDQIVDLIRIFLPSEYERGPAGRPDRRAHRQGRRAGFPTPAQGRQFLRGAAGAQGLRRRPVAGRAGRQAGRVRRRAERDRRTK